jgi:uncharacterized protein
MRHHGSRARPRCARVTTVLWLLLLLPLLAGLAAQRWLGTVFGRYRALGSRIGVTGAQLARALLDAHGLGRVRVEAVRGRLSDHYDGAAGALRLSRDVALGRSVAAMAIATHEVSHAYQDAEGSHVYRLRRTVGEPLARLAPWSGFFFIGGFWFGMPLLMLLSIVYAAGLVVFALATLPVELGASHRAVALLRSSRLVDHDELSGIRRVLTAAAFTYLVGLMRQLGLFCLLVLFAEATGGVVS